MSVGSRGSVVGSSTDGDEDGLSGELELLRAKEGREGSQRRERERDATGEKRGRENDLRPWDLAWERRAEPIRGRVGTCRQSERRTES